MDEYFGGHESCGHQWHADHWGKSHLDSGRRRGRVQNFARHWKRYSNHARQYWLHKFPRHHGRVWNFIHLCGCGHDQRGRFAAKQFRHRLALDWRANDYLCESKFWLNEWRNGHHHCWNKFNWRNQCHRWRRGGDKRSCCFSNSNYGGHTQRRSWRGQRGTDKPCWNCDQI